MQQVMCLTKARLDDAIQRQCVEHSGEVDKDEEEYEWVDAMFLDM
jgi:hypothetical protein